MKKILVPCDFSEQAISAFRMAIDFARQSRGQVHLVNVIEIPVIHDSVLMPVLAFEETLLKELEERANKEFKKLIEKYAEERDKIKSIVLFGPTSFRIIDYANDNKVDLILMGTKGASGVREFVIGSNTERIVRRSSVPVIAIKKYIKAEKIKNIVFPNTLETEHQEDLVMKVKALQNFFDATLHIVFINTPVNFTPDRYTTERLKKFVKRYMIKNFTLNVYNDPYEEDGINRFAQEINAEMIALGTHGRKGLAHALSGSIAEDTVNHVSCPVWTYSIKN